MSNAPIYPKRLIEVDLPIKKISAHARREKSTRQGHISTLHIWWARRPLAACRAVILATLWPDPADPNCPEAFFREAATRMRVLRDRRGGQPRDWNNPLELRAALLDFIADFADWDLSTARDYLETSRALVQAAYESLGGAPGTRPLVVDPFAGGGAIPLEALRVGADAYASDLNPVAVLLNKVILEYTPNEGGTIAQHVRTWGRWVGKETEKELGDLYPRDPDGAIPIAYLFSRLIRCEGPGCGAELPLIRSLWLSKKSGRATALKIIPDKKSKKIAFEIIDGATTKDVGPGTVRFGSATCPVCQYSTPVEHVRAQLKERHGGARDARLSCVVTTKTGHARRFYRLPTQEDEKAIAIATERLHREQEAHRGQLSMVPDEPCPRDGSGSLGGGYRTRRYGIQTYADFFTARQALVLATLVKHVRRAREKIAVENEPRLGTAVATCLALAVDRLSDRICSLATWRPQADQEKVEHVFTRQALSMTWDFAEGVPLSAGTAGWEDAYEPPCRVLEETARWLNSQGHVEAASATLHPLPDDVASAVVTDPPYYDAVPYSELSDYFYVWLRRSIGDLYPALFQSALVPKASECIVNLAAEPENGVVRDRTFFEQMMRYAMTEARRITRPDGLAVIVFAHKSTVGWETQIQAMLEAGWIVTASWPLDTELGNRLRAQNSAALGSSIHIVCRPRESQSGAALTSVGDWRDVLAELPKRIREWMPRLAEEGVVGADAIFSCLGPALEIFSRYSRVEKASGENVTLRDYLEHVWAAVAQEALTMIFSGADATGFEEDARLTAMWLWTVLPGGLDDRSADQGNENEHSEDIEDESAAGSKSSGFVLEYDAARKIAQGLGVHLEQLTSLVAVKGSIARLLPVAERTRSLFFKGEAASSPRGTKSKKKRGQLSLGFVADLAQAEESGGWGDTGAPQTGETVLDRIHQSMILFGAGRSEALKRFLVDDGIGRDDRFWRLAQALSALYPTSTDEKRWVDGVLARKKGLGL